MYIMYSDDSILEGPDEEDLWHNVADIKLEGLDITEEKGF